MSSNEEATDGAELAAMVNGKIAVPYSAVEE